MILYNIGLRFLHSLFWIAHFVNAKANLFVKGRRQSFIKLDRFNKSRNTKNLLYWFHCASLGEFEQARPLMEAIKIQHPETLIAISFFSPSGYEIQKNYATADLVFYLPMASKANAQKVLYLLQPQKIFFIKYEFWLNYINVAHRLEIPVYLVSALFNPQQLFFKWYGTMFLSVLRKYSKIFVQDKSSFDLLQKYQIKSIISGDTRFDRVLTNKTKVEKNELIESFAGDKKIIVLGSSWQQEERLIFSAYQANLNYKIIIAPHDIKRKIKVPSTLKSISYSQASIKNINGYEVLIIDNIGMLASLYGYAHLAFVGGGYRGSLHNILEAAVFGIPVVYGYQTQKHPEAEALQKAGGGIIIDEQEQLSKILYDLLTNDSERDVVCKNSLNFIIENAGATQKIMAEI